MKKEEIYINLQGKTKEELTDLSIMCDNVNLDGYKYLHFSSEFNEWLPFGYIDCGINKTEITIEQLKQIIKPMVAFTPISMKCTQEQFESIKPKLKGINIESAYDFDSFPYLINYYADEENNIGNVHFNAIGSEHIIHETWNEEIFLKACGIEVDSLEQQLQKAQLEVKRLQSLIEEENKVNILYADYCRENPKEKVVYKHFKAGYDSCSTKN